MIVRMFRFALKFCIPATLAVSTLSFAAYAQAEPVVPGTGTKIVQVGDDFEEEDWVFYFNGPKSTETLDKRENLPTGLSKNNRWYEGVKRGYPDIVRRVETPPGGPEGSKGALLLQSLYTGWQGSPSYQMQQDDFVCNVYTRLGGTVPVWQTPSCIVRVYLPPVDQWEARTGPHFGFRLSVDTMTSKKRETYWPGMFINFESKTQTRQEHDYAYISIRSSRNGQDYKALQIAQTGWWTLGMTCTPDGQIHYYAKPGLENLTPEDRIASEYPYGYRCERFQAFFFNVCSADDGRHWSTPWIIDNAEMFFIERSASREVNDRR